MRSPESLLTGGAGHTASGCGGRTASPKMWVKVSLKVMDWPKKIGPEGQPAAILIYHTKRPPGRNSSMEWSRIGGHPQLL
jgi:hypothetical protein